MIKRLQTPEDISILFHVQDDVEQQLSCSRSEWIQWLVENVANLKIGVWAKLEDNQAKGYVVAVNNILLPISNNVGILYIWYSWSPLQRKATQNLVKAVENWGRENGAKQMMAIFSHKQSVHAKIFDAKIIGQVFVKELMS